MACLFIGGLNYGLLIKGGFYYNLFDYRWSLLKPVWLLLVFITCFIIGGLCYGLFDYGRT